MALVALDKVNQRALYYLWMKSINLGQLSLVIHQLLNHLQASGQMGMGSRLLFAQPWLNKGWMHWFFCLFIKTFPLTFKKSLIYLPVHIQEECLHYTKSTQWPPIFKMSNYILFLCSNQNPFVIIFEMSNKCSYWMQNRYWVLYYDWFALLSQIGIRKPFTTVLKSLKYSLLSN